MFRTIEVLAIASALGAVTALAACGGGGGGGASTPASVPVGRPTPTPTPAPVLSPTPTPIPVVPGGPASPGSATFTVYTASVDGQTLISMAPVSSGPPDSTHTWAVAPGAYVIYPDKSIQLTDAIGSFDASKAPWTQANAQAVALNPNASPQLRIAYPSSKTPAVPLLTQALPLTAFDSALPAGGAVPSTFRDVVVVPSGAAMFDDETRVFEAVGQDGIGGIVDVESAVQWSLQLPPGCTGTPAGTLTVNSLNQSLVTYHPPATGTFVNACYDQVVATIPNRGSTTAYSSTANAIYFATAQALSFSGKVVTAAGAPVPFAIVDLYGASGVAGFGDLLAQTNYSGQFTRTVPPQRPLTPFVDNLTLSLTNPSVAAYTVAPSTVAIGPTGGVLAPVTFVEGAPFVNPAPPPAPSAFNVINSFDVANGALLDVPFGLPDAGGHLPACSISALIGGQSTIAGCGGAVGAGGLYGGWSASAVPDPATGGMDFAFLQPAAAGSGQSALSVKTNITSYTDPNGSASDSTAPQCSTTTPCVAYARYFSASGIGSSLPAPLVPAQLPAGTILQVDGVFVGAIQASNYNVNLIRNVYTGNFQVQGQPQRAHAEAFSYPLGSTSVNFTDHWYNSINQQAGNFTFSRQTTATGFTFAGSGAQSYFRAGFAPDLVQYAISNGVVNLTAGALAEAYTTQSTNGPTQTSVNWSWTGLADIGSAATGSIVNAAGTTTATFTVNAAGQVTVTGSPANGGGIQQFLL